MGPKGDPSRTIGLESVRQRASLGNRAWLAIAACHTNEGAEREEPSYSRTLGHAPLVWLSHYPAGTIPLRIHARHMRTDGQTGVARAAALRAAALPKLD